MSVRIGFGVTRPKPPGHGQSLSIFRYLRTTDEQVHSITIGYQGYNYADLLRLQRDGKKAYITVLGWLRLAADVDPYLADAVIGKLNVIGAKTGAHGTSGQ